MGLVVCFASEIDVPTQYSNAKMMLVGFIGRASEFAELNKVFSSLSKLRFQSLYLNTEINLYLN